MTQFLVISYSLLAMFIVVIILSKKGMEEDNNLRRKQAIDKETAKGGYKNVNTSFKDRVIKPIIDKMTKADKYGSNISKNERQKKQAEELAIKLRKAGIHMSVANFNFFKTAFMIIMIIISMGLALVLYPVIFMKSLLMGVIGAAVGIMGPTIFLNAKVKRQQEAIKLQLADTIDLLSVCMEAGLSFDASLVKISERMSGPLIDEFMTVFKQVQLGKNRNDALKSLGNATDVQELKTFVSAVIQANQLGIPITNVLTAQAEQLRANKTEEIKEVAAKIPTKMTIPTVVFILPTVFITILGPIIFGVIDNMKGAF